jgi:lipopolysaccharide export LptBFGC system permease protein LptF
LRDLHQLYCLKSSHLNASSYFNVPPCGNMYLTLLHWKLLAPLHVLVLFLACACICCASYLLMLNIQVYICLLAHHVLVFLVLSLIVSCVYFSWLFWVINGLSHFGGVICLVHVTILKLCVHEKYHIVLILQDYLVSMWYVILMRNSNL